MNTQLNWKKIRDEIQRLAHVETLQAEVQRIGSEIRKFDFHTVLSPTAKLKVKSFEKRYAVLMRTIQQTQRQMDREFNRLVRQIKVHRSDVSKVVAKQKITLAKKSKEMKKRFASKAKPVKKGRITSTSKAAKKKTVAGKKPLRKANQK